MPIDTIVKTNHQTYINGKKISYVAETGTQPVWNKDGVVEASLFYTFYRRTDVSDNYRPIIFSFNGGPGSASVWMHLAYTGPRILKIDDEGYPIQPYGYKNNPYSILDTADIVFINPVNTAYSRMHKVNGEYPKREKFFWYKCRYLLFIRMAKYICHKKKFMGCSKISNWRKLRRYKGHGTFSRITK